MQIFEFALVFSIHLLQPGLTKPLEYPDGIRPGDSVAGQGGEYWRYKNVLVKPPDDDDRIQALKMAEDVKCTACNTILRSLMKKVESNSEDHIMDQLDGESDEPVIQTDDQQENRVLMNKKGCNKHFKDELLMEGWTVRKCEASAESEQDDAARKTFCMENLGSSDRVRLERNAETFSVPNEAAFIACESTVARHGFEIASLLAKRLEKGGALEEAIHDACLDVARCDGRPASRRKPPKKEKKKEPPRTEDRGSKETAETKDEPSGEEDSYQTMLLKEQEEERKSKKRRRKKGGSTHTVLSHTDL